MITTECGDVMVVRCSSCNAEVILNESIPDPNGKPLCRKCFRVLAMNMADKRDLT